MSDDRRKISKKRNLEDIKQKLYQAQASGDRFQIMVWQAVLKKLENTEKK